MRAAIIGFSTLVAGCAYVEYTEYEGRDASGPTAQGSFVNREYRLPIYKGLPPHPYKVVGLINASDRAVSFEGTDHAAVRVAVDKGADAVLELNKSMLYGGSEGGAFGGSQTTWNASGQANVSPGYVQGTASGRSSTGSYGSMWTRAIWLEQAQFVAIKWTNPNQVGSKRLPPWRRD